MTYAHLGRSGLLVSRIGLGTMNFGYTVDEPSSFAVMDAAIDAGVNFFDTADVYGGPQSPDMKKGTASQRRRSASGCSAAGTATTSSWPRRCSSRWDSARTRPPAVGVPHRRGCEASLRRLQTDHIDLYQMHHVDRATPWRRSGRRWSNWSARARSAMSAAATSPAGMWPLPSAQLRHVTSWA